MLPPVKPELKAFPIVTSCSSTEHVADDDKYSVFDKSQVVLSNVTNDVNKITIFEVKEASMSVGSVVEN